MSRQLSIAILGAVLVSSGAAAQEVAPNEAVPLTLRAALAEALERNPQLLALRAVHDAARAAP